MAKLCQSLKTWAVRCNTQPEVSKNPTGDLKTLAGFVVSAVSALIVIIVESAQLIILLWRISPPVKKKGGVESGSCASHDE